MYQTEKYEKSDIEEEINHIDERLFYLYDMMYEKGDEKLAMQVQQLSQDLSDIHTQVQTENENKNTESIQTVKKNPSN
ncbi:hypothetical protein [Halalkalicoccus tibetensis]|uniref:Spo0E like sporulation regulatory protein n=1 Tax=Halalkalicoccus tibetensis TaxID=175632 RepID=A0ABD5V8J6_9EURY